MSVISSVWWSRPAGAVASCVIPPSDANETADPSSDVRSTFVYPGVRESRSGDSDRQAESRHQAGRLSPHAGRIVGQVRQQPLTDGGQGGAQAPDAVGAEGQQSHRRGRDHAVALRLELGRVDLAKAVAG